MVLLLTVRPCCADNCAIKEAAPKTAHQQTSPKEKECPGCSPFFSCGSCVGFVISTTEQLVYITQPEQINHNTIYQQPYLKELALAIWQPPQLG